jgi:hypothetical protein
MWHDDIVRTVAQERVAQLVSQARGDSASAQLRELRAAPPAIPTPSVEIVCVRAAARARSVA